MMMTIIAIGCRALLLLPSRPLFDHRYPKRDRPLLHQFHYGVEIRRDAAISESDLCFLWKNVLKKREKKRFYSDELESLIGNRGKGDGPDSAIGSPSGIDNAHENPSNYPGMEYKTRAALSINDC